VLLQAAIIGALIVARPPAGGYQTASGPQSAGGFHALVGFADGATAAQIADTLAAFGGRIVDGPKPGGIYKVRFAASAQSGTTEGELLRRLTARKDVVKLVLPSRQ
jgi:hypothetical protein